MVDADRVDDSRSTLETSHRTIRRCGTVTQSIARPVPTPPVIGKWLWSGCLATDALRWVAEVSTLRSQWATKGVAIRPTRSGQAWRIRSGRRRGRYHRDSVIVPSQLYREDRQERQEHRKGIACHPEPRHASGRRLLMERWWHSKTCHSERGSPTTESEVAPFRVTGGMRSADAVPVSVSDTGTATASATDPHPRPSGPPLAAQRCAISVVVQW